MSGMPTVADQAAYFEHAAAVRARDDLCVVRVSGEDAHAWLNGQTTHDVRSIGPGVGAYGLVVSAKGKVLADVWVFDRGNDLAVAMPRSVREALRERFESQVFMEDVAITEEPSVLISVQGPRARDAVAAAGVAASQIYRCDELGRGGVFVACTTDTAPTTHAALVNAAASCGGGAVDEASFELARLRAGRPRFGVDFSDRNYPQEAGLKDLAVSFSKGCYLGQEVVCTLEHRGRLNRHLVRLDTADAPGAGDVLTDAQGDTVGALTSVIRDPVQGRTLAFGYVKRALATAGAEVRAGAAVLTIRGLVGSA